ncbi:DUF3611 family protein [Anabaena sp. FACHB-1237]|uniref:DUF3611 family protein n=1 Tax=Anabaena sp. FACHB-1237 TaxID=2692769 RepID=UPI0016818F4B|nr:DUF3611 family protein [Anabaena sp. FACHB-1237]MBD2138943.1 DUF3611 family protein [Anabaena sp. FACHB-1237]
MSQSSETPSSNIRAIAQKFRLIGWISFWTQLVLGVVSSVILLTFSISSQKPNSAGSNPGTAFGVFLAICGLIMLGIGIYIAFRYTRVGLELESSNPNNRPRRSETVQVLRLGLWVNLGGVLATLLGSLAIVGVLTSRAITQTQFFFAPQNNQPFISGLDMFVVQSNLNTILAHFTGLLASLWLINRITK